MSLNYDHMANEIARNISYCFILDWGWLEHIFLSAIWLPRSLLGTIIWDPHSPCVNHCILSIFDPNVPESLIMGVGSLSLSEQLVRFTTLLKETFWYPECFRIFSQGFGIVLKTFVELFWNLQLWNLKLLPIFKLPFCSIWLAIYRSSFSKEKPIPLAFSTSCFGTESTPWPWKKRQIGNISQVTWLMKINSGQ